MTTPQILKKIRLRFPDLSYDSGEPVGSGYIKHHDVQLHHILQILGSRYAITGKGGIWKYNMGSWEPVDLSLCYFIDMTVEDNLRKNETFRNFIEHILSKE